MTIDLDRLKHSMLPMIEEFLAEPDAVLEEVIQQVASQFQMMRKFSNEVKEQIIAELRTSFNTTATLPAILRGSQDYKPWLEEQRGNIAWNQWLRYKYYLRTEKRWEPNIIDSLDETSDEILDLLANPKTTEPFERKGLVMGYVQSGKTANYTALINKALDAGFKVVIVLSGMHNNLRSQTQLRLDEEVLGFTKEPRKESKTVGVGLLKGQPSGVQVTPLTIFGDQGDFSEKRASFPYTPPIILIVKKQKTILTNLVQYLRYQSRFVKSAEVEGKTHPVILQLPLLLVDDEADQASVNTSEIYDEDGVPMEEYDPSKINGLIRDILNTFEQRAYVGYTATPFANMLIDRESYTAKYEHDLFPRDFIVGLPKPSNYCGPAEYFNLKDDADRQEPGLLRLVEQVDSFIPVAAHKKTHEPIALPSDLIDAIYSYLIATAIRRLRGQKKKHSSMLVHVTRFQDVQSRVVALIKDKVEQIKSEFRHGRGQSAHDRAMKKLYDEDFVPTSNGRDDGGDTFDWDSVRQEVLAVLEKLQYKEINGRSGDVLNYSEYKDGLYVLAVGGDKLSRGLTLEDLTVSYYLRPSQMYDTLMQMGRWFGYRPGYLDLCRIYTTEDLANDFHHVAIAVERLREQLDEMAELDMTPEQYVLQIPAHPSLRLTSPNKMGAGQQLKSSYSADSEQTTLFLNTKEFFARNFQATERFLERLGDPKRPPAVLGSNTPIVARTKNYYWEDVPPGLILYFLEQYQAPLPGPVDTESIRDYILSRNADGELTSWTVVLINSGEESTRSIAGLTLGPGVQRIGQRKLYTKGSKTINIRILTSEGNEWLDYTQALADKAKTLTKPAGTKNTVGTKDTKENRRTKANRNAAVRGLRSPQRGLLLLYPLSTTEESVMQVAAKELGLTDKEIPIGFAISFPKSDLAQGNRLIIVNKSVAEQ